MKPFISRYTPPTQIDISGHEIILNRSTDQEQRVSYFHMMEYEARKLMETLVEFFGYQLQQKTD